MKIGLSGNSYVKLGLQTFWGTRLEAPFERAKQLKIRAVEVFFDKKGCHGFMPPDLKSDARKAIKAEIAGGIEVSVHAPMLDFEGKTWKKELADTLAFCDELGCAALTIHPPVERGTALSELANISSGFTGITKLLFENTPDITVPSRLDGYISMFSDLLGKEIGITFDAGHANLSGMPPWKYIDVLRSPVRHLHIHDNKGLSDEHLSPGNGTIDFVKLFKVLADKGFKGTGILEYWRPDAFEHDMIVVSDSCRDAFIP